VNGVVKIGLWTGPMAMDNSQRIDKVIHGPENPLALCCPNAQRTCN